MELTATGPPAQHCQRKYKLQANHLLVQTDAESATAVPPVRPLPLSGLSRARKGITTSRCYHKTLRMQVRM